MEIISKYSNDVEVLSLKAGKTVIATEKKVVDQVKEFLAFIITLYTFVNLLNDVSIDGQWISLKATSKAVFEILPIMGSDKKISKRQMK